VTDTGTKTRRRSHGLLQGRLAQPASWKVALLVAIAAAAGLLAAHEWWTNTTVEPLQIPAPDVPPGEYLYLDSARVAAYLSQIEDGLSSSELRTLSHTSSFTIGAGGGSFVQAQGTSQTQNSLQETVSPTAGSLLFRLERKLRGGNWLRTLNAAPANFARFRAGLGRLEEGTFVRITNCRVVFPGYGRVYPAFGRQAPVLPLSFELKQAGERVDLLFPIAYSRLANEPSLFSTRLTVLGKVVRRVDAGEPKYVDGITERAFRRALQRHGRALARLRLPPATLARQFRAAVTVRGPGVVVLPIAIFK
jgi:hypothetical protein